ncbi:LOW QUALITY PROTEIN: hypothetical protein CVT26_000972 [Gymnopilus dilepis]|uniref:Uncharacterized protein n=1 Tax=Gymnopilus dilepis TaxID=231916 RepID=A0A409WB43_9AGAR|nr:LOW QUALITY PROTEIN: hypothetical protein CVT26_000972 [Gymnopilus dilepis]
MSDASICVATPDVLNQQQILETEKCAVTNPKLQDTPQVLVEALVYDSGQEAWLAIAGAYVVLHPHFSTALTWNTSWMVQFCTYGYVSAFGIYQDYYTRIFLSQESPSNIRQVDEDIYAWIGSFQLFMQYIPGFVIGRAFDAGYFHYMMALGTFLQITSMFMLSLARPHKYFEVRLIHYISPKWKSYLTVICWHGVFLAQAVGMGLGQSLLFLPSLTIIGHHFRRRRALATGIAISVSTLSPGVAATNEGLRQGASFGGIVWPILLNELSQRISFSNSIRTTAALCGLMLITSNFLMKTRSVGENNISRRLNMCLILQDSAYLVSVASPYELVEWLTSRWQSFLYKFRTLLPICPLNGIADFYLQLYAVNHNINDKLAFYSVFALF